MRARDKRMGRLRRVIEESPVRRDLLREAYAWFTDFGELPDDDDHIAYEVVAQALRGGEEQEIDNAAEVTNRERKAALTRTRREALLSHAWPPSVRFCLFEEALFDDQPIRRIARAAIAAEVAYGGDVESYGFAARHGIPMYGSTAMHILGYPSRWILPPFEDQATCLFTRFDTLRARIDHDDPNWFDVQAEATVRFLKTGKLPDDDLHFEFLLANLELDQLMRHKRGKDVTQAMALFEQVQRRDGEEQEEALRKLCAMAVAGKL